MNLFGLSFILYFFKLPYGPDKLHKKLQNFMLTRIHTKNHDTQFQVEFQKRKWDLLKKK